MKITENYRESYNTTAANHAALNEAYSSTSTGNPADTVKALVSMIGYTAAVETVAELVNSVGSWDGRISSRRRAWAESIDTAADNAEMRRYGIYSSIHPAHIDQLAEAMSEYQPEEPTAECTADEPAEENEAVTADDTAAIAEKLEALKEWQALADEAAAEIEALKDEIKQEMNERNIDTLKAGKYTAHYTSVTTNRFDSSAFKAAYNNLYQQFLKTTTSKRFIVT